MRVIESMCTQTIRQLSNRFARFCITCCCMLIAPQTQVLYTASNGEERGEKRMSTLLHACSMNQQPIDYLLIVGITMSS